jgi:hypothetical protein
MNPSAPTMHNVFLFSICENMVLQNSPIIYTHSVLHILRMCNSSCFSAVTTFTKTRLNVTLYYIACFVCAKVKPQTAYRLVRHFEERGSLYYTRSKGLELSVACNFFKDIISPHQWKQ